MPIQSEPHEQTGRLGSRSQVAPRALATIQLTYEDGLPMSQRTPVVLSVSRAATARESLPADVGALLDLDVTAITERARAIRDCTTGTRIT